MKKGKILIIEDEPGISELLKLELEHEGYEAEAVSDGITGLDRIKEGGCDLVLLDLMLPGLDGIEVCRKARMSTGIPIIIITARDRIADKVTGLDTGADDYLTKPFSMEELLARIRRIISRSGSGIRSGSGSDIGTGIIKFRNITLNKSTHEVKVAEQEIRLTNKEYRLLEYMLENTDQVLTRDRILDAVWGYEHYGDSNVVDIYIMHLRNKLSCSADDDIITTVRGSGYLIKQPEG